VEQRSWRDAEGWVDRCVAEAATQDWTAIVLHDVANACLARLPELLEKLAALDVEWRQDFPESVVMTRAGAIVNLPDAYIASAS
jgi:peptidoglycan-N-acetylglucosamine deacetylase